MEFSHYDVVPLNTAQSVIQAAMRKEMPREDWKLSR
jgi:hypothetical protein